MVGWCSMGTFNDPCCCAINFAPGGYAKVIKSHRIPFTEPPRRSKTLGATSTLPSSRPESRKACWGLLLDPTYIMRYHARLQGFSCFFIVFPGYKSIIYRHFMVIPDGCLYKTLVPGGHQGRILRSILKPYQRVVLHPQKKLDLKFNFESSCQVKDSTQVKSS